MPLVAFDPNPLSLEGHRVLLPFSPLGRVELLLSPCPANEQGKSRPAAFSPVFNSPLVSSLRQDRSPQLPGKHSLFIYCAGTTVVRDPESLVRFDSIARLLGTPNLPASLVPIITNHLRPPQTRQKLSDLFEIHRFIGRDCHFVSLTANQVTF